MQATRRFDNARNCLSLLGTTENTVLRENVAKEISHFCSKPNISRFNFAISNLQNLSLRQANYLVEGSFWARNRKIALKWLNPLLRYAAAILLWRLHIIIMMGGRNSRRKLLRICWNRENREHWTSWNFPLYGIHSDWNQSDMQVCLCHLSLHYTAYMN